MRTRESILVMHWRSTLKAMEISAFLCNSEEGEEFICSTCDRIVKPCLGKPGRECPDKIHGDTQFRAVRDRFRSAQNGHMPLCVACGRPLTAGQLRHDPLSEVCSTCRGSVTRKKGIATMREGKQP